MYLYSASFIVPQRNVDTLAREAAKHRCQTDWVLQDDGMVMVILVHAAGERGCSTGDDMVAAVSAIAALPQGTP